MKRVFSLIRRNGILIINSFLVVFTFGAFCGFAAWDTLNTLPDSPHPTAYQAEQLTKQIWYVQRECRITDCSFARPARLTKQKTQR
jgi:hypothetical protein